MKIGGTLTTSQDNTLEQALATNNSTAIVGLSVDPQRLLLRRIATIYRATYARHQGRRLLPRAVHPRRAPLGHAEPAIRPGRARQRPRHCGRGGYRAPTTVAPCWLKRRLDPFPHPHWRQGGSRGWYVELALTEGIGDPFVDRRGLAR